MTRTRSGPTRPDIDMSWHERAACNQRRHPEVDPAWFAPLTHPTGGRAEDAPSVRKAFAVCATCAHIFDCDKQAKAEPAAAGVWAGRYIGSSPS